MLAALAAIAAAPAAAHTPYRQWKIMRERNLLVHSTRTDPASDRIAEAAVATLHQVLPKANALVARARDEQRVASLLTTGQAMLAIMRPTDARDLYLQRGDFAGYAGEQLRALLDLDDHQLVTVERFPQHHAWLVTAALMENPGGLSVSIAAGSDRLPPLHRGALAFANGEPLQSEL